LQGLFSLAWTRWPLLLGLFVIIIMTYLPQGLVGLASQRWMRAIKRGDRV
jgi:branched-chain amino acid transport system permease protein